MIEVEPLVREVNSPDHLEMFISLLLDDVPHQALQLVVLVVPGGEHLEAICHNLNTNVLRLKYFENISTKKSYMLTRGNFKPKNMLKQCKVSLFF